MSTIISRLSSNGVLFTSGTFDEVTYTTNKVTPTTVCSGNFDEITYNIPPSTLFDSLCLGYIFDGNKINQVTQQDDLVGYYFLAEPYTGTNSAGFKDYNAYPAAYYGLCYPTNLWVASNNNTPSYTVTLWYSCSTEQTVYNMQGDGNRDITGSFYGNMAFRISLNNSRCFSADQGYRNGRSITTNIVATTGVWYHLAYVYNKDLSTTTLYVNGSAAGSAGGGAATGQTRGDFNGFAINGTATTTGNVEHAGAGKIDDYFLWTRALSQSEIIYLSKNKQFYLNPTTNQKYFLKQDANNLYTSNYIDEITGIY